MVSSLSRRWWWLGEGENDAHIFQHISIIYRTTFTALFNRLAMRKIGEQNESCETLNNNREHKFIPNTGESALLTKPSSFKFKVHAGHEHDEKPRQSQTPVQEPHPSTF